MIGCCFKVSGNGLKFEIKSKQKKNDSLVSGTPGSRFLLVSGIPGSFDSRCPGYQDVGTPQCPGHRWSHKFPVSGTPGSRFLTVHCFFQTSGHFFHPLKQQSIKKQCGSNIYYTRTFGSYFQNFPNFIISLVTPGVPDTGESS